MVARATKVHGSGETAPEIAREALDLIGRVFAVEKQAKDASVAERLALRQTQSVPVLVELRQKLLTWKEQLLPKHLMAEAANHTLGQWEELTVFTASTHGFPIAGKQAHAARCEALEIPLLDS